ncbi:hypothetical protein D3C80_1343240 [compost metagenome]
MAAAAQLQTVPANLNYANNVSVFLTEQRHSSHCFSFIDWLQIDNNVQSIPDLLIDASLYLRQLFRRDTAKVREVKAQSLRLYQ